MKMFGKNALLISTFLTLSVGCGKVTVVTSAPDQTASPDEAPPVLDMTAVNDTVSPGDLTPPNDQSTAPPDNEQICSDYCDEAIETCIPSSLSGDAKAERILLMGFNSRIDCQTKCRFWAGIPVGNQGDTARDTIQCRIYHTSAAKEDPNTHCPHASLSGGNKCGSWCEVYCHLALRNCTGSESLYQDLNSCLGTCTNFAKNGEIGDTAGDSVQCRIEMALRAGSEPPGSQLDFCPNASSNDTTTCVSP